MNTARDIREKMANVHQMDDVIFNCTACGASYEAMLDGLADVCVPDGKPHPRRILTQFDPLGQRQ